MAPSLRVYVRMPLTWTSDWITQKPQEILSLCW
nr:MAG TPA: hypothetical protein [Caudoviricetes sp.]